MEDRKKFFKKNGMLISHYEEVNYKLDELGDSDKSVIYIENSLKEIKVHVDDEELTFFFDSEDKLKEIRKMFIEDNDGLNICCEQKHAHDLIKLINKCGYGFIIKDSEIKQAKYRAFIIKNKQENLLEDDLQKNVIEALGKRVLKDLFIEYFKQRKVEWNNRILPKNSRVQYSKIDQNNIDKSPYL
ncbi:hypothetical protein C2G38_2028646 [Gigaspora rosea]|uniref:Uncharacterized protein n=1 Tax=Gigaspora rosea TaxID=44941 RepID=A0A397W0Q6_9GLOM|nr:hypothetical protein C2G38_2028646 [Gigaspora rosea]